MKWQRYLWTATILAIWVISLLIVDSAAKQTRMGYQQQNLQVQLQDLEESNLRLKCEMSVLHDLEKAEGYAETMHMEDADFEDIIIASDGNEAE